MSRQAIVGLFSILAVLGLFVMFWFVTNLGTRVAGYRFGVHFPSAGGLHPGAQVFESGVPIGTVVAIRLLPDFTVDAILAINPGIDIPRDARFIIQAPLTGDSTLVIVPPPSGERPTVAYERTHLWPHALLPVEQQPQGIPPASISDLMEQGQSDLRRVDAMLTDLQRRTPAILDGLQSAVTNANALAVRGNRLTEQLSPRLLAMIDGLQASLAAAGSNVVDLTGDLKTTARAERPRVDALLTRLDTTAIALNQTVDSLKTLAADPRLRGNLTQTTQNIALASARLAAIAEDARKVTSDPQTQAQLRDTVANIDAVSQKANSLLGGLGGTSSVYGVDQGATPAPGGTGLPGPPRAPGPRSAVTAAPHLPPRFSFSNLTHQLVTVQARLSELSPLAPNSDRSAVIGPSQGPDSDFNLLFLPYASSSLLVGANDLGGTTSYNFALLNSQGPNLRFGGGVLYSRLGLISQYQMGRWGLDGRIYDPQHPTLDMYGDFNVSQKVQLFGGERDTLHSGRRTVFGLQLDF